MDPSLLQNGSALFEKKLLIRINLAWLPCYSSNLKQLQACNVMLGGGGQGSWKGFYILLKLVSNSSLLEFKFWSNECYPGTSKGLMSNKSHKFFF